MTELSLLDYLAVKLRFWRTPPEGVPTLRRLWMEDGSTNAISPSVDIPKPRRRSPQWIRFAGGDGPWPLGIVSALALALAAQAMLTADEPAVAVVLLAGTVGAAFYAVRRGEVTVDTATEVESSDWTDPRPRPLLGIAATLATILVGLAANGNRAGAALLLVWIAAVGLTAAALTTAPGDGPRLWRAIRNRFHRNWWTNGLRWPVFIVIALIGVAVLLRTSGLAMVPAEMMSIHAELLQAVHSAGQGEPPIIAPSSTGGFAPIPVFLDAILVPLAGGLSFISLKLGTVLAGLLTLPFIYLLGREVGGRMTGICALALAAVGQWPNLVSRLGFTDGWYPPFAAAALLLLLRGIRRGRRADFVAAGVVIGLAIQTHPMARSLVAAAVILLGLAMIPASAATRRRLATGLGVVLLLIVVTGLPTIIAAPEPLPQTGPLWWLGAATGERDGSMTTDLLGRTGRTLMLPLWSDGPAWFHGGGDRPALDRVAASLLVLGLALAGVAAALRRRFEGLWLVMAIPLLMLPAILAPLQPHLAPSPLRCGGAMAPVFVLAGIGFASLIRAIASSLAAPSGQGLAIAAAVVVIGSSAAAGHRVVHGPFAETWDRSTWNASELGEVIRGAIAVGIPPEHTRVVPFPHWVDTRLVAAEAGLPGEDLAISPDLVEQAARRSGPHFYLVHPNDRRTLRILKHRLPAATMTQHSSRVEGKVFLSVMTLSADGGG